MEMKTYQNPWDTEKAVLSGFFFSYGELIRINPFIRKEKYSK